MPRTSDLQRFKKDLRMLAHEDEIREGWGEPYVDIPVPDTGLASDLSELLEDSPKISRAPDPAALFADLPLEPGDAEGGAPDDFSLPGALDSSFGGLDHYADLETPPQTASTAPGLADSGFPSDIFGAKGDAGPQEGALADAGREPGAFSDFADSGFADEAATSGAGLVDTGEPLDFASSDELSGLMGSADGGSALVDENAAADDADAAGFSSDDFTMPDFGAEQDTPIAADSGSADFSDADFSLPGEGAQAAPSDDAGFGSFDAGDFLAGLPGGTDGASEVAAAEGLGAADGPGAPDGFGAAGGFPPSGDGGTDEGGFSLGGETSDGFESGAESGGFSLPDLDTTGHDTFSLDGAFSDSDFSAPLGDGAASGPFDAPPANGPASPSIAGAEDFGAADFGAADAFSAPPDAFSGDTFGASAFGSADSLDASAFGGPSDAGSAEKGKGGKGAKKPKGRYTEEEVDRLQDSLLSYPLNLRLAIESIIAEEKGDEAQQLKLVQMMVDGASAVAAADFASRILKKPISVPKGFEKRTGAAFEARKGTFAYAFVHHYLPLLEIVGAALAGMLVVGLLVWNLIVVPLQAEELYNRGIAYIAAGRYDEAMDSFRAAQKLRIVREWYYKYAEAFDAKDQFVRSEDVYGELLDVWPRDVKGALDFARSYRSRRRYEQAVEVLEKRLLNWDYFNLEGLLALGDTALDWADFDNPAALETARVAYAKAMEAHGQIDPVLERMMVYLIRAEEVDGQDRRGDVYAIRDRFMSNPASRVSTPALAEVAGYMLDRGDLPGVYEILVRAVTQDRESAEAHYQLARYYRDTSGPEEGKALAEAERLFAARATLERRALTAYFDTLDRAGLRYLAEREAIDAERYFRAAIALYEDSILSHGLKPSPLFGGAYAHLADVMYFFEGASAYEEAIRLYERAAAEQYDAPDARYKRGWLHYQLKRYDKALAQFHAAGVSGLETDNLLFATAAAFQRRDDLFSAEGYYSRLIDKAREELRQQALLRPQERLYHNLIVKTLMQATTNLGVVIYRSAERSGDSARRAEAMALFIESAEYFDALRRDPDTLERLSLQVDNYGYLNIQAILHPNLNMSLLTFDRLEKTLETDLSLYSM